MLRISKSIFFAFLVLCASISIEASSSAINTEDSFRNNFQLAILGIYGVAASYCGYKWYQSSAKEAVAKKADQDIAFARKVIRFNVENNNPILAHNAATLLRINKDWYHASDSDNTQLGQTIDRYNQSCYEQRRVRYCRAKKCKEMCENCCPKSRAHDDIIAQLNSHIFSNEAYASSFRHAHQVKKTEKYGMRAVSIIGALACFVNLGNLFMTKQLSH